MKNTKTIMFVVIIILLISGGIFIFKKEMLNNNSNSIITSDEAIIVSDQDNNTYSKEDLKKGVKGPILLNFNLNNDIKYISNYIDLEKIFIDFDGDGKFNKEFTPNESISYKYDKPGIYKLSGFYKGKDKIIGSLKEMNIDLPIITIK